MISKITTKNQITIPKKIINQIPDAKYFDVELKDGVVLLKPLTFYDTDLREIRAKLKRLGLKSNSVTEAVGWARSK
jgi:bifunctional DNA-binding transcriptional regulator/antitoxin component of YhaV-PrlF toxin-antitoxin module